MRRFRQYWLNDKGFTIFEMLVVMAVLGFVLFGANALLSGSIGVWRSTSDRAFAQQSATTAVHVVATNMRRASEVRWTQVSGVNRLIVTIPQSPNVLTLTYYLDGTVLKEQRNQRGTQSTSIVASNVTGFTASEAPGGLFIVSITCTERNKSYTASARASIRA